MKYIFMIIGFFFILFYSCSENKTFDVVPSGKIPTLSNSENLGCSALRGEQSRDYEMDTLFYQIQNDTLIVIANFFKNCAFQMEDSLSLKTDTVDIFVDINGFPDAGCVCDFEFNYYFIDYGENIYFSVYTKYPSAGETDYTLWKNLIYP